MKKLMFLVSTFSALSLSGCGPTAFSEKEDSISVGNLIKISPIEKKSSNYSQIITTKGTYIVSDFASGIDGQEVRKQGKTICLMSENACYRISP